MADYQRNRQRSGDPTAQPAVAKPTGEAESSRPAPHGDGAETSSTAGAAPSLLPALTLPKGGGAIRGIGEKFQVSAATGTASLGIPLPISPARSGFGPSIDLAYDSGSGNGPFGLGFHLSVPAITRKTDKGLPRYIDDVESDEFILSGAEDLVPLRDAVTGALVEVDRGDYLARRYRPRVEGSFARIERWVQRTSGDAHWRVTTPDNVTHVYGSTPASRIADPQDSRRVFSWLLERSQDDKGNIVRYEYKAEDGAGIGQDRLSEQSRFDGENLVSTSQRYLKRVHYCNAAPFVADDFLMELVFDYGEHATQATPDETQDWPVRSDPFSTYRPSFEVRTYRLCRRALMFHRLSADRAPLLVKSTDLEYEPGDAFTYLIGVTQAGYLFQAGVWQRQTLPTLRLDYFRPVLNDELKVLPAESVEGLEGGVDGAHKQWVDLDGEGIPGVLIDDAQAWHYKSNRGDAQLSPPRLLSSLPAPRNLAGGVQQLADFDGDGELDLVSYGPPLPGYFSHAPDGTFESLRTFASLPNIDFRDPNLRFVDLDGDGHADLLISDDHVFVWYRSKAKDGFEPASRVVMPNDDALGPAVVFADSEQRIQLADMSGDGLVDIVRIRRAEVCYWPNLGYGRFGKKITLENCPELARQEEFDARRVRFADVDGSGTSDLFYLGSDGTTLYRNAAGNRFAAPEPISSLPPVDSVTQLSIVDLLGQGTACLVWSSPLPSSQPRPILYVDLMAGIKPHLLRSVVNNLGAETRLTYAASTKFYLADKAAGTPWLTRLAFPVHVVERVEHIDAISKSRLASSYSYHHGFFDGVEREFRGFARVEQLDTEEFTLNEATELFQAPVRTVTWYHTGAWLEKERLESELQKEYFQQGPGQLLLADTVLLPDTLTPGRITTLDEREATRALRGRMLRQEVYADDGTDQAKLPYVVTEQNFAVRRLQTSRGARHGVFLAHARESVTVHTERNPDDPRVAHDLILDVDDFGMVTRQASIVYARATGELEQRTSHATLSEADFVHQSTADDVYRIGTQVELRGYEVTGLLLPVAGQGLIAVDDLRASLDALDPTKDLDFEQPATTGKQRRLIHRQQRTFYTDDAGNEAGFGLVGLRALPYRTYQLALTAGNVAQLVADGRDLSGTAFDPTLLVTEGKYQARGNEYWSVSGRAVFSSPEFYLPLSAIDPFGNAASVTWDDFNLLPTSGTDALGNQTTSDNDYRVLAPAQVTDANLNRVAVAFDALGMVIATAVMGKAGAVPAEGDTLADPTTRLEYDLLRFQAQQKPVFVHTFAREQHAVPTRFQETFAYSDGFGRIAMQKVQAEPGDVPGVGNVAARWVGTGRTVFNNKGNPVKQYEPFFSATSDFEDEDAIVATGVTPIIHYDPIDRVIRTELPDGSESRVEFDAWLQRTFDPNDAIAGTRWLSEHQAGTADEQRAAALALKHADTPTTTHLDALGRAFLVQADNGPDPAAPTGPHRLHDTRSELDITGTPVIQSAWAK